MRPLQRRTLALAASALAAALLTTGCSEIQQVSEGVDKAQQCLQAAGIVTETMSKVAGLINDPAAMEKALNDGAAQLGDLADKAANTSLKEAADGVAASLEGFNVNNANEAVDAAQKIATDGVKWVEELTGACA
ncbi:hypothetical protein [Planomonospora venezuelensis]|uniref:Na+-transporting NADH:ubiquinone oxidoreductase subunit NqrC n=1 Tax=Planomonospora venezuelensis TaxID=1999 RepID=A0A841D7V2_PLAVE|nr:hypothetical protein [Planomonospora venezuelensis]MBB5964983.1 Na+-transporting NADH:ubiquinone oxidoreductase subunit NqrC [Planomonospora venezuelensis]GIN05459.1 hypothetical protein Pve01_71170 [Planomonospora venezuelensis]